MTVQKKSLLFTLQKSDIQSLMVEEELKKNGYKTRYFIDTHDIVQYAFPLGLTPSMKLEQSPQIIADRQVGYQYLFKYSKQEIILPKDYRDEALGIRSLLFDIINGDYRQLYEDLIVLYDRLAKDQTNLEQKKVVDLVKDNLSLLTYIIVEFAIGNFDRFEFAYTERTKNETNQFSKIQGNSSLYQYILSLFDVIITERENRAQRKLSSKRFNAQTDALVITKIAELNRSEDDKVVNYYFSSSDWSDPVIQKMQEYWPVFRGEKYSFLRSQKHVFAQMVLSKFRPKERLEIYQQLLDLLNTGEKLEDLSANKSLVRQLNQFIEDERNSLENYGIILRHQDIAKDLGSALINTEENKEEIVSYFVELLSSVKTYLGEKINLDQYFQKLDLKLLQLNFFDNLIDQLNSENGFLERNFGVDPIVSIKQQLPIVFDYGSFSNDSGIIELMSGIRDFYLNKKPKLQDIRKFKASLLQHSIFFNNDNFNSEFTKLLAYLIVPRSSQDLTPNNSILNRVAELINKYKTINREGFKVFENTIFKEFRYIQVWAARRIGNYEESLNLAKRNCLKYPEDPRFKHGRCLALYCLANQLEGLNQIDSHKMIHNHLNDAIYFGKQAMDGYSDFTRRSIFEANHSIEVLINTLAFLHAKRAEFGTSKSHDLTVARDYIVTLKRMLRSMNDDYNKYPEYLTTESYVELLESVESSDPRKKLSYALKSVDVSIKLCEDYSYSMKALDYYHDLKSKIEAKILEFTKSSKKGKQ